MNGRYTIASALPKPSNVSIVVENDQNVSDIMKAIAYMHKKNFDYYDSIANNFLGSSVYDTCENIWDFCKSNIPYTEETEEWQTVKNPQRILNDAASGVGHDCKHYASFIGGILDALRRRGQKINWCFRFVSYRVFKSTPGHVFVVVKNSGSEIWVDPVLDSFDEKKSYYHSQDKCMPSAIGTKSSRVGSVIGGDNKTAATLKVVGGVITAVAPTIAAAIPVGTVVAACMEVVGFAVAFVGSLFQSKYQYSTQVRWLIQNYQIRVLGQASATSDNNVNESYVNEAQMWFAAVLGVPVYDNIRYHTLRGTTSDTDKNAGLSYQVRAQKYQALGPIEAAVPFSACLAAAQIADGLDDHMGVSAWANFPPANIVLQQEGITAEQAVEQASGVLTGSSPNDLPTSTIYTSLLGSDMVVPLIIGGAALLLIMNNKD